MSKPKCPPHDEAVRKERVVGGKRWTVTYCSKCGEQMNQRVEPA